MIISTKIESLPESTTPSDNAIVYFADGVTDVKLKKEGLKYLLDLPNGTELVTNGDFTTDTGWTKGAGWTIVGGKAVSTASTYLSSISQTLAGLEFGATYKVSFDIVVTTGNVYIFLGTNGNSFCIVSGGLITQSGTYSFLHHKNLNESGQSLIIRASSDFTGTLDNISVKRIF